MHSLLTNTTDLLRVVTGSAADLDCIVSFIEYTNTGVPVLDPLDTQFTNITGATTTTILAAPTGSTKRRRIKSVSIVNTHATVTTTVRVVIERSGPVLWDMFNTVTLAPGESLTFTEGLGWFYNRAAISAPVINGNTAAMAQGFAADTYVTGSNLLIGGRIKQLSMFRWKIFMSKTAASTAVTATIIRFGTAGAIGDTARVTMAGPAQTAAVDEACLEVWATVWTSGASGVVRGEQSLSHSAAIAAGFGEMFDSVSSGAFDLTVGNLQVGISMNGGAAAAWTVTSVQAEAINLIG